MTYNEIINIARRLDKETQEKIDKEVEAKLEILKEGDLNEEEMDKMEECLYMSLVIQEYLEGEYELLEEEKMLLLAEMEELYNEYGELLTKAKLEEKLSKKKRMALELMKIREQLFDRKDRMKDVNKELKENRANSDKFKELSGNEKMKEIAKENKEMLMGRNRDELPNPDKLMSRVGFDNDSVIDNVRKNETLVNEVNNNVKNTTRNETPVNLEKNNVRITGKNEGTGGVGQYGINFNEELKKLHNTGGENLFLETPNTSLEEVGEKFKLQGIK